MSMEENIKLPKEDNNIPLTVEIVDLIIDMLSADASRARMEKEILKLLNKAAYATKLHQANEVIKVLEYDNNKLKGQVEGLTSAVDELKGKGAVWVKATNYNISKGGMLFYRFDGPTMKSIGIGHFVCDMFHGVHLDVFPKWEWKNLYILDESPDTCQP